MAHADLDEILNCLLPFAQQMLEEHGEFFPFGAWMKSDGEIELVAGEADDEKPPSQDVIDLLADAFRAKASAGEIRAAGICYDVRFRTDEDAEAVDAVCASLDHAADDAVDVFLPYELRATDPPSYGEPCAAPGSLSFFSGAE